MEDIKEAKPTKRDVILEYIVLLIAYSFLVFVAPVVVDNLKERAENLSERTERAEFIQQIESLMDQTNLAIEDEKVFVGKDGVTYKRVIVSTQSRTKSIDKMYAIVINKNTNEIVSHEKVGEEESVKLELLLRDD